MTITPPTSGSDPESLPEGHENALPPPAPRAFKVTQAVIIDRPVAEVFAFRCALASSPDWRRGVVTANLNPPGPISVGSCCTELRTAPDDATEEWRLLVSDYESGALLGIIGECADTVVRERHVFVGEGGVTRYTLSADVTGGAVSSAAYHKALLDTLLQLKWALEGVGRLHLNVARRSQVRA